MFEIFRDQVFSASHQLRGYKGRCERLHGHNWRVRVYLEANELNELGMVMDFHALDKIMSEVVARFDHQHLNDVPPFDEINPSSENIAATVYQRLKPKLEGEPVSIASIEVWETPQSWVIYSPD